MAMNTTGRDEEWIEVAAGLVFRDHRLLITRRPAGAHLEGLWEFPGGKRHHDESWEACLRRELREELGIEADVGGLFGDIRHRYPEKSVHLRFFLCRIEAGEPRPIGCSAIEWILRDDLDRYPFPEADAVLLEELRARPDLWGSEAAADPGPMTF